MSISLYSSKLRVLKCEIETIEDMTQNTLWKLDRVDFYEANWKKNYKYRKTMPFLNFTLRNLTIYCDFVEISFIYCHKTANILFCNLTFISNIGYSFMFI